MPVDAGLHNRALSHMPARVVYLSAAAAVEDSGICVGREGGGGESFWSYSVLQE